MKKYLFQSEVVDIGLSCQGPQQIIGPIVLAAVFLPSSRHQETLLRYDLLYNKDRQREKECISDQARYNRIMSLNYSELGYLVKSINPEEVCNLLQAESPKEIYFSDLIIHTFKNFIKIIIKKLKFRVKCVHIRYSNRIAWQTI